VPENDAPNTSPASTGSRVSNRAVIRLAQPRFWSLSRKIFERIFSRARWSRRTIIIASFLFLLILSPVGSQTPRRIDPRILAPFSTATPTVSAINPTVSLKPEKGTVQIGESVKFTATLNPPRREVIYAFEADGGSIGGGMDQTEAVGRFSTPGSHVVNVRALIRGTTLTASTTIQVKEAVPTLPHPVRVQLSADKPQARVGEAVTFTISTTPDVPNLDYQFDPGDGSPIHHGKTPSIQYAYSNAKSYTASVTLIGAEWSGRAERAISVDRLSPPLPYSPSPVATAVATVAPSIAPHPTATPSGSGARSVPWKYVIPIGLLVVIVGILLHWPKPDPKPTPMAARPTFHPHWDWGSPPKQHENVTINYELHFDPNLSKGRHRLETGGASLIISRKKKQ
jgi:hypothetical protein